jgi:hypothetical protein
MPGLVLQVPAADRAERALFIEDINRLLNLQGFAPLPQDESSAQVQPVSDADNKLMQRLRQEIAAGS